MGALSLLHLLVLVAVVAAVVLLIVFALRRWRRSGTDPVIGATLTLSALYAVFAVIAAVLAFVGAVTTEAVSLTVPVREFWPALPEGVTLTTDGGTATKTGGGFTQADLTVAHASTGVHLLWASGQALSILVPAAIAGLIALACFQLLRGAAFSPVMARAALITAVVVLVGGSCADVLSDIAGSMASSELFDTVGASGPAPGVDLSTYLPQSALRVQIPLWPIGAGLGFAALAAIFRYGSRLQQDTDLLV